MKPDVLMEGGREVTEGQAHGLYLFDPELPPPDQKGWPLFAVRLDDGEAACGSPKKRGGFCESPYRFHNGRCNKHGGNAARGPAHGSWMDGKRSKYMKAPEKLREGYERALTDPQLTHHRTSIALTDALIEELLESYDAGANPETWKAVKAEYNKMRVANASGDRHNAREHFEALGLLISEGSAHPEQAMAIVRLLEARRKHADSETRRKLSENIAFSYEQAYTFYTAMGTVARKHFGHDQERLRAFVNEITAISGEHGLEDQNDQRVLPPES